MEKPGGVIGEKDECGDADVELLVRERRSLDILSLKKEAWLSISGPCGAFCYLGHFKKLRIIIIIIISATALTEVEVSRGEEDFRCKCLFIVCQRRRGLSEDERLSWRNIVSLMQESDYGIGY